MSDEVTLVTGSSGFLGTSVMKLLAENSQRAIGLDPRASATTQMIDDLSDRARLKKLLAAEKVTHIIHAGGVSGPMVLAGDPVAVVAINVLGSLNLLYAAIDTGVSTSSIVPRLPRSEAFMKTRRSATTTRFVRTTPTVPQRPRWSWCCADYGAKFPSTSARCVSP
jgi:nucleoside-diphosphate-sugar epimerase